MKEQELVTHIDSELIFIKPLMRVPKRPVYKVKKNEDVYVLKVFLADDEWNSRHLNTERTVLERAKDLTGITRLAHFYGVISPHIALLKEYAAGEDINLAPLDTRKNTDIFPERTYICHALKTQINDTVQKLHNLGIADLDLSGKNVVISPDKKSAKIVDLGHCVLQEDVDAETFELSKSRDLYNLKHIF